MKLSRNVLVGSLATVGMVLGAVAPAITAQAATTGGVVGSDGTITSATTDAEKKASNLANDDKSVNESPDKLAIAFDNGTTNGTAGAKSNANVTVVSGALILNAVPDFGFGTTAAGSTAKLASNNAVGEGADGNNVGLLQVTDARATADTDGTSMGFTLGAQLNGFKTLSQDGKVGDAVTTTNPFTLTLNPMELANADGDNISLDGVTKTKTSEAALKSDATSATNVMDLAAGTYKNGQISTSFNTPDSAKLAVPSITGLNGDYKTPKTQSYTSTIDWTLTATPAVAAK